MIRRKSIFILFFSCFVFACTNQDESNAEGVGQNSDTLESGIIEYDLNQEKLSAVDYNNELSLVQQNVWNQLDLLFMADSATIDQHYETTLFEIETKLTDLRQMYIPEGGEKLSSSLISLLMYYQNELGFKFKPLLVLMKKPLEQMTRKDAGKLTEFDLAFAAKEKELVLIFAAEQDSFAAANNFQMEEL